MPPVLFEPCPADIADENARRYIERMANRLAQFDQWAQGEFIPAVRSMYHWWYSRFGTSQAGVAQRQAFTISDLTADRTYDADATSTAELADVLGTLINDLGLKA